MGRLTIEMNEEEIQKDAVNAVKVHNFSGLEEVIEFINKVEETLSKVKKE